jgi:phenylpropionate dioxygenase-like ring-hydroxylating dioxygenase large terminal subunit
MRGRTAHIYSVFMSQALPQKPATAPTDAMNQHDAIAQRVEMPRASMQSVAELLAADTFEVPPPLLEQCPSTLGNHDVDASGYVDPAEHQREVTHLWGKVWQWACRAEQIPNVGDSVVYDITHLSFVIVRVTDGDGANSIRAYENVCQHRGTRLRVVDGNTPAFRCPFHGWTWNLDGSLREVPCQWDFPDTVATPDTYKLPQVQCDVWQGFVFINPDLRAGPLDEYLERLPDHFSHFPLENRFTAVHVQKVMPANWKVVLGAFIESYHSVATHPQILPFTGDANTQYDIYERHSRMITPFAVASPHIGGQAFAQVEITRALARYNGLSDDVTIPEGVTARQVAAQTSRKRMSAYGADLSQVADTLMVDAIEYFAFPNFMPWAAYGSPLQYRFRPNGDDVNSCIMDVLLLLPFAGTRPPAAAVHRLSEEEPWTAAPQLGGLGAVFEQDTANLRRVQQGLRSSSKRTVTLGDYQEARIRHFHQTLAEFMAQTGSGA